MLLLSFVPCADRNCSDQQEHSTEQTSNNEDGEEHGLCTPFCNCSGCHNIISIPTIPFIEVPPVTVFLPRPESHYRQVMIEDVTIDFFQPPQLS